MKLTINKDFYIDIDTSGNYALTEHTYWYDKDGREKVKVYGYFCNTRQALEKYIKLSIANNNEVMTIQEYLTEFRKMLDEFKELYKEL